MVAGSKSPEFLAPVSFSLFFWVVGFAVALMVGLSLGIWLVG